MPIDRINLGCPWEGSTGPRTYRLPLYSSKEVVKAKKFDVCVNCAGPGPEEYPQEFPGAQSQPWFGRDEPVPDGGIKQKMIADAMRIIDGSDAKVIVVNDGNVNLYSKNDLQRTSGGVEIIHIGNDVWAPKGGFFHCGFQGLFLQMYDLEPGSYFIVIACSAPRFAAVGATYNGLAAYHFDVEQ